MLDVYDAQMLDYHPNDLDVQMNTSTSSDSWAQEEATMEDDDFHSVHRSTFEDVSVEVDMEGYDEDSAEYYMPKAAQESSNEGGVVDVEVYDASQVHSPVAVPLETFEVASYTTDTQGVQLPSQGCEDNKDSAAEEEAPSGDYESLPTLPSDSLRTDEHVAEGSVEERADQPGSPAIANGGAEQIMPTEVDARATAATTVLTTEGGIQNLQEIDRLINGNVDNGEEKPLATTVEVSEIEDGHLQEDSTQGVEHQDPHEISEGVYIDPPPSVLLTVDITDNYDVSLFNEFFNATAAEDGNGEPDGAPSIVLLQDRPTLYYENLSSLFEAFRQSTFLSNIPEVSEGELILDAYDLQLVMPEDNCYARGVSLHEINVLHDSCGLTGPLRLKLRLEMPRFIIRYQTLQGRAALILAENHVASHQLGTESFDHEPAHGYQLSMEEKAEGVSHHGGADEDENDQGSSHDGEERQGSVEGDADQTVAKQENGTLQDSRRSQSPEDNSSLEYVDNAETDVGIPAVESEAYEATSTTDGREGVVANISETTEHAPANVVGEVSSNEDNQDHSARGSTPSSHTPEVIAEHMTVTPADGLSKEGNADTDMRKMMTSTNYLILTRLASLRLSPVKSTLKQ
jgi:hypothetical protein